MLGSTTSAISTAPIPARICRAQQGVERPGAGVRRLHLQGEAEGVGERLDAGLVWANCWLVRDLATPFGGMKQSGVGREGGEYSRDVFTNVRTLHIPM